MDLKGLDSQWRGFSDSDIQRVKSKPLPSPDKRNPVQVVAPSSSSDPPHPPINSSRQSPSPIDDDHISIATTTLAKDDGSTDEEATPPDEQNMPAQQSETAMLTQQTTQQSTEAELSEKLSPAQKALQLKRQQEIEDENKKRKKLVEERLKERYAVTQQEAQKLKKVHADLASLDKLVTRDVAILREKIETANVQHNIARARYERAEKEFVAAKLELHKRKEEKELLSDHLCAIIHQTELRKAKKLAQLCQALGMSETLEIDSHS